MSLIEDIRTHTLDPKFPLSAILREAMVLARKLKSEELTSWVQSELQGYRNDAELPAYRKFRAVSEGTGANATWRGTNVIIPTYILPDVMRRQVEDGVLFGGVRELESLIESNAPQFHWPWPDRIISHFNYMAQVDFSLVAASQIILRGLIEHVLDTVRTKLLQFVLEIEELNPDAGAVASLEQVPSATTHQIYENVIMKNTNYYGDVQKFHGNGGSIIATGQARISSSHAAYTSTSRCDGCFSSPDSILG